MVSSFYRDARTRNGLDIYCKDCRDANAKLFKARHPEYNSRYHKKRRQELAYTRALLKVIAQWEDYLDEEFLLLTAPPHLPIQKWKGLIRKELSR